MDTRKERTPLTHTQKKAPRGWKSYDMQHARSRVDKEATTSLDSCYSLFKRPRKRAVPVLLLI